MHAVAHRILVDDRLSLYLYPYQVLTSRGACIAKNEQQKIDDVHV